MSRPRAVQSLCAALPVLTLLLGGLPAAWADSAQATFEKAFFLEQHKGDLAEAEKLYADVAADKTADEALRQEARTRRDGCREEIAASDFPRLMPPNALAYAELNRPGEQIVRLLGQIGLLRDDKQPAGKVARNIAFSPELVRELFGLRGVAAAITGFDPEQETPTGVAILHPGRLDVLRGLLEAALPIHAAPQESIDGFATYQIEGEVLVTITARLIILSNQRHEIEGVIERLRDPDAESLATNADMADMLKDRQDALLHFCVNIKPVLPLIQAGMAAAATQNHELAVAQALFDIRNLKSVTGRLGVSEDGLFLDVALNLNQGHRNLAFNFLRMPPVDQETLRLVPAGAAGFVALALNEPQRRRTTSVERRVELVSMDRVRGEKPAVREPVREPAGQRAAGDAPPVTFLDLGRELFANIICLAVFALPEASGEKLPDGAPMPNVALVMTVNDPAKSAALWTEIFGIASLGSGGGTLEGTPVDIDGAAARRFTLPEGVSIYFATSGDAVILSPTRAALSRAIATRRGGPALTSDPAFSRPLARLTDSTTVAAFAHAGRCLEMARAYMDERDLREAEPYAGLLTNAVGSLTIEHSDHALRLSVMASGLPNVGPMLSELLQHELGGQQRLMTERPPAR